jgi:hypothetical protein
MEAPDAIASGESTRAAFDAICASVAAIMPAVDPGAIDPAGRLSDYGCNSLDRADIVWQTLTALGLDVPVAEFGGVSDIPGLTQLLARHLDRRRG